MKAARVLRFGPPNVITNEDVPKPEPGAGQLLVRVKAAGVGHWDALIREGKVQLQPLPLTLGSELSGIIEGIGADVSGFELGDEVYGATNEQFGGAYAEYAVPSARRMAPKPTTLGFIEAASVPIVTVTAWQMLFEYAHVTAGQTVLIHGAAGNVGAYAVQLVLNQLNLSRNHGGGLYAGPEGGPDGRLREVATADAQRTPDVGSQAQGPDAAGARASAIPRDRRGRPRAARGRGRRPRGL